jgi:hypothetical protein
MVFWDVMPYGLSDINVLEELGTAIFFYPG